jgi:hypothetical protein
MIKPRLMDSVCNRFAALSLLVALVEMLPMTSHAPQGPFSAAARAARNRLHRLV